jgi:DNA-binding CsgD family transcriptional regulator
LASANPEFPTIVAAAEHARGLLHGNAAALLQAAGQHRHPWARASAAEDAGVLLAARGDGDGAIASFDQAMAAYRQAGAERDVARVRSRLARLGERRRHWRCAARPVFGWASLTDTERRVANLVAEGLTNRQVGERMFLSRHTVDFHLRQIYRKLDITSRVDLTRLVLEHEYEEGLKAERA